jgi:hypothetical protein
MTNRIYFQIPAVFILLICILSFYYNPVNARAVNSTTATSAIGSPKPLLLSPISPSGFYKINVNGTAGNLTIRVVSANNDIVGSISLYGQPTNQVVGVYDNVSSKLTFMRIMSPSNPLANQVFTGYLMGNGSIIGGSFEALPQAGGTAYRSIFGWYGFG